MKILIVDDELVSRKKMQKILDGVGECEAVESGIEAIAAFEKAWEESAPFDLITLDVSMPEMDGTEVLYEIKQVEKQKGIPEEKQVKIIMATCHSDKDTIITSIQAGCDNYITKPFDRETLFKKLEKLGFSLHQDLQDSTSKGESLKTKAGIIEEISACFKRGEVYLPAFSQVIVKFKKLIDAGANLREVAEVLKQDAAICSKLISVSNSPSFRGIEKSENLEQAVNRLGLDLTKQYVHVISNRSLYAGINKKYTEIAEKLWDHSLSCAYASQIVSDRLGQKLPDDPFIVGLLHDIGKLVLLQVLDELDKEGKLGEEVEEAEVLTTLDQLHARFGAALLKKWEFSSGYIQSALYHDNLESAEHISKGLLVIHFANLLVKSMGYNMGQQSEIDLEETESFPMLNMDSSVIDDIKDEVRVQFEALSEILA